MLSAKYCIPIVYPNFYKGTVLCLDIIDCRNDNQKNTKIISYSNSHTVRPVLYKNDNNEEFKLSPEEYKKALDEVEKILDKEEEIIDNHLNDIIN
ncbi:hypothetical protein II582_04005 [bacterium]|nr:hypothetical protein [bacterium]